MELRRLFLLLLAFQMTFVVVVVAVVVVVVVVVARYLFYRKEIPRSGNAIFKESLNNE